MSLFLDTGVIVAYLNPRDAHHDDAVGIIAAAIRGDLGDVVTSDYVFDEVVTLTLARTRRVDAALRVGELILGSGPEGRFMDLAYVTSQIFLRSWALFRRFISKGLSFTDCTSVELMRRLRMSDIASFDSDFDGIVTRRWTAPA